MTRLLSLALLLLAISGCSRPPSTQPLPSPEHPACIDVQLPLDGKTQAWQTSDQDLFTVSGVWLDQPKESAPYVVKMTVCYKGRQ